jgi:hypothetical protein
VSKLSDAARVIGSALRGSATQGVVSPSLIQGAWEQELQVASIRALLPVSEIVIAKAIRTYGYEHTYNYVCATGNLPSGFSVEPLGDDMVDLFDSTAEKLGMVNATAVVLGRFKKNLGAKSLIVRLEEDGRFSLFWKVGEVEYSASGETLSAAFTAALELVADDAN